MNTNLSALDRIQPVVQGFNRELATDIRYSHAQLIIVRGHAEVVVVEVSEVEGVGDHVNDRPDDDHVGHRLVEGQVLVKLTSDTPPTKLRMTKCRNGVS